MSGWKGKLLKRSTEYGVTVLHIEAQCSSILEKVLVILRLCLDRLILHAGCPELELSVPPQNSGLPCRSVDGLLLLGESIKILYRYSTL